MVGGLLLRDEGSEASGELRIAEDFPTCQCSMAFFFQLGVSLSSKGLAPLFIFDTNEP